VHVHATPADRAALARCVGDVDRFATEVWSRRVQLCRNTGGSSFDDLLSLDAVDHLLATTAPRLPAFRLVRDGSPVDPARYTRRTRLGGKVIDDVADVARVHALFAEGVTLVLQGLHRSWLPLTRFCRSLERVLGHHVQANAYVTPAGAQGLGLHADPHDVFTLQVLGRKSWQAYAPGSAPPEDDPVLDAEVGPGDTLYLPRGARHAARTTGSPSVHLTIGVLTTPWSAVLDAALASPSAAALGLADPLPFGWPGEGDGSFEAAVGEWLGRVRAWLADVDTAAVAEDLRAGAPDRRPPVPEGQLGQLLALGDLDDDTVLRHREGAVVDVVAEDDRVSLVLADRTLHLPRALEPVLRTVAATSPLRGRDLGEALDETGRLVLLRRLVREGLLEALPDG